MRFTDILPHNGISGQHDDIFFLLSAEFRKSLFIVLFSIKEHDIEFWWPFHVHRGKLMIVMFSALSIRAGEPTYYANWRPRLHSMRFNTSLS